MQRNSTAKKLTATIVHAIYNTLLPDTCALCEQILTPAPPDHLCPYCPLALPYNLDPCTSCGIPLQQSDARHCGPCITAPLVDQAVVPLLHDKEAAYLLHRFKFQKNIREGQALAQTMLQMINATYGLHKPLPQYLIPTPIAWQHRLLKGFDHAQILATMLSRETNIPVKANLLRRKYGPPQRQKTRAQRLKLTKDTYTLRQPARAINCQHVAVVDDVLTTGTTARHIVQLLRRAGVRQVDLWCATRAI